MFAIRTIRTLGAFVVLIVIPGDVSWLFGTFQFFVEFTDDAFLNLFPRFGVNGVCNVGVKLGAAMIVDVIFPIPLPFSAMIAVAGPEVVFGITGSTMA